MNIHWPNLHHTNTSIASLIEEETGFWITSPSLLRLYPALAERPHVLVEQADDKTLFHVQQNTAALGAQRIIAFGGGKVLDIAKLAARLGSVTDEDRAQLAARKWIPRDPAAERLELTALPTTAGSGSETSEVAVLTVEGRKVPLHHASLLPDRVILNVNAVNTASARVMWNGLWDTFVHALESALSPLATDVTRGWSYAALGGIRRLIDKLAAQAEPPSDGDWAQAQWLCALAGKAQSIASVGLIHALAHQLEAPGQWHGEACARVLPFVAAYQSAKVPDKYVPVLEHGGWRTAEELVRWAQERVGGTVGALERTPALQAARESLIANIGKDPCFRTNPAYMPKGELAAWLEGWLYA